MEAADWTSAGVFENSTIDLLGPHPLDTQLSVQLQTCKVDMGTKFLEI